MKVSVCGALGAMALPVPATPFCQLMGDHWLLEKSQLQGGGLAGPGLLLCRAAVSWTATEFDFCLLRQITNGFREGEKASLFSGPELGMESRTLVLPSVAPSPPQSPQEQNGEVAVGKAHLLLKRTGLEATHSHICHSISLARHGYKLP